MARINKVQRDKAIAALKKAGAPAAVAASMWRLLDLDENLDQQIADLVEEDPELFASTEDEEPEDEPPTTQERKAARARGEGNPYAFKRPAQPRPQPTATKSALEIAEFYQAGKPGNLPPVQKYMEPVRDINDGHKRLTREPSASVKRLADRLKGN